jgi:hypothetical protein
MSIETSPSTGQDNRVNLPTAWNEAHLIDQAINERDITTEQASAIIYEQLLPDIIHTKMFVELPPERLKDMGKSQGEALKDLLHTEYDESHNILETLAENKISLSIAMQDGFDEDELMLQSLRELNEAGITPTLWLVLDDKLGYWSNKANVEETVSKLDRMLAWAKENDIKIDKVGLDYEPPIELLKGLINKNIPQILKEAVTYAFKTIANKIKHGNLQEYLDRNIVEILDKYNYDLPKEKQIGIETYAAMEPLRKISDFITFKANENSDIVTMSYTSTHKKPIKREDLRDLTDEEQLQKLKESQLDNPKVKEKMTQTLDSIDPQEIPDLGIIGSDPYRTPGRDLREYRGGKKAPELHLSQEEFLYNVRKILGEDNNFQDSIREYYVFALNNPEELRMVLESRENAPKENIDNSIK